MEVGFVGLGAMGQAMAGRLIKAGHRVRVWSRSAAPSEAMRALGATVVATAREAFAGDAFVSMLSDDDAVRDVVIGGGLLPRPGLLPGPHPVHVNMATVSVGFARTLAAWHAAAGVRYVSAPVFGRTEAAAAGRLHILAAGEQAAVAAVQKLFDAMGQRTWLLGPDPSQASIVKIGGNFMVACAIEAMAEAMALCRANGVPAADFLAVMGGTIFDSPIYKGYGSMIAAEQFEPAGFRLALGLKDVRLTLEAGEDAHAPLPFASLLRDSFLDAIAQGDGDKDWAAIAKVAARRAGL
jgi:3-hydroxyisobutyrate dehydrogenase-like beta-hydroxyacid dehydrogenase